MRDKRHEGEEGTSGYKRVQEGTREAQERSKRSGKQRVGREGGR